MREDRTARARFQSGTLLAGILCFAALPAHANISFDITYGSSITGLSYASAVEADINSVINEYESLISNNITVSVDFENMTSGLGESDTQVYEDLSYNTYCQDLKSTIGATSVGTTIFGASGSIGTTCATNNPVTGSSDIDVKTADARAVGYAGLGTPPPTDGTISLNTAITDAGGCTTDGSCYALVPVIEHELDEVLGLGSSLGNTTGGTVADFGQPFPEDLFRFSAAGTRSYVNGVSCSGSLGSAYFSTDNGTTNLAGFNNACNGGDWADWDSGAARVQNAFASPLPSDPALGIEETALEAIGYDMAAPEPSTLLLVSTLLGALLLFPRRKA